MATIKQKKEAIISDMKKFMCEKKVYVSWTFTMTKTEYNFIAPLLMNHFKEVRIDKRAGVMMPYEYRIQKNVKYWIELTISK